MGLGDERPQAREHGQRVQRRADALRSQAAGPIAAGKVKPGDLLDLDAMTTLFGDALANGMYGQNPAGGISFIEISKDYPRGYAYRIWTGHTAGDAPGELDSAGKIILTSSDMKVAVPWSEQ